MSNSSQKILPNAVADCSEKNNPPIEPLEINQTSERNESILGNSVQNLEDIYPSDFSSISNSTKNFQNKGSNALRSVKESAKASKASEIVPLNPLEKSVESHRDPDNSGTNLLNTSEVEAPKEEGKQSENFSFRKSVSSEADSSRSMGPSASLELNQEILEGIASRMNRAEMQEEQPTESQLRDYTSVLEDAVNEPITFLVRTQNLPKKKKKAESNSWEDDHKDLVSTNKLAHIHLALQKPIFKLKDTARGVVYLNIFKDPMPPSSITLHLQGYEKVQNGLQKTTRFLKIFDDHLSLFDSFSAKVEKGHYEYHFEFKIPENIGCSTYFVDRFGSKKIKAKAVYWISVRLTPDKYKYKNMEIGHSVPFKIFVYPEYKNIFNSLVLFEQTNLLDAATGETSLFKMNYKCNREAFFEDEIIEFEIHSDNSKGKCGLKVEVALRISYLLKAQKKGEEPMACSVDLPNSQIAFSVGPGETIKGEKALKFQYDLEGKKFGPSSKNRIFSMVYFVSARITPQLRFGFLCKKVFTKHHALVIKPKRPEEYKLFVRPKDWDPKVECNISFVPKKLW